MHTGMLPTIRLRTDEFRQRAQREGLRSDTAAAAHLGLHRNTVMRILSGEQAPGERMIACSLTAFPDVKFDDLFEVVVPEATDVAA